MRLLIQQSLYQSDPESVLASERWSDENGVFCVKLSSPRPAFWLGVSTSSQPWWPQISPKKLVHWLALFCARLLSQIKCLKCITCTSPAFFKGIVITQSLKLATFTNIHWDSYTYIYSQPTKVVYIMKSTQDPNQNLLVSMDFYSFLR